MAGGGVALRFRGKFRLLQFRISRHAAIFITKGKLEHAVVEGMKARERHELELVAHRAQFALELGDRGLVQLGFPIE